MSIGMTPLQWARNRRWLDEEIRRLEAGGDTLPSDMYNGMLWSLYKVKANMFLTDNEQVEVERTRREMFAGTPAHPEAE